MKTIKLLLILVLVIFGCKPRIISITGTPNIDVFHAGNSYVYENGAHVKYDKESFYIEQELVICKKYIGGDNPSSYFEYLGNRNGFVNEGKQEGKWESYRYLYYDSLRYNKSKKYIFREEYFKNGLHDSIYKIYNKNGILIYSTYFKNGNGIEKDYHQNGKLYYEIETKNGHFADTLRLFNEEGKLFQKKLYKNDTLTFVEDNIWCLVYRYNNINNNFIEVDSYQTKNFKKGIFKNTFKYKTKEQFFNDNFAKSTLIKNCELNNSF